MEMPKEVEKEKSSLKSRVKTGLRRVSTRLSHPRRTASAVYPESTASDSSDDALHVAHPRSLTTSTSSSSDCAELQVARTKVPGTPDRKDIRVRQRVVSLGRLLFPLPPSPASHNSPAPDCSEKPPHIPRKLKKRARTASTATYVSSNYMSFSAIEDVNTPSVPPGDLHQSPSLQEQEVEALDPFLVDDPEDPEPITPAPIAALAPTPATDSRDITPSHEVEISTPPLSVTPEVKPEPSLNVDKPVPPPPAPAPASESSEEDEPEVPAVYLPQLVLPTMFLPIPNTDPLSTLLTKYIADERRRPPRDISGDYSRADFHTLVMTNSWRAIARLARDRLVQTDPEDLDRVFNLWYLRLSSLARLRLFNQTTSEAANLQNVLVSVPQSTLDRIVPFELQVLFARTAYWAGSAPEYADALGVLLKRCRTQGRRARHAADRTMWRERGARVALIAASRAVESKDYASAISLIQPLLQQPDFDTAGADKTLPREVGWELRAALARVYLQAGLLGEAEKEFSRAAEVEGAPESSKVMAQALLACARGEWAKAEELLASIVLQVSVDAEGKEEENFAAVNDLAVALLAQGKIKAGIEVLERALKKSPGSLAMAEPFLFNLSTLYELRSAVAADKKRELLLEVAKWSGDGLRVTCLKLPTN
ncbi:unnamed protein product [Peniophora sp. CBMAI 1063]|nr:unnamed protein product [Peniophora sp. CBMAI 1063]